MSRAVIEGESVYINGVRLPGVIKRHGGAKPFVWCGEDGSYSRELVVTFVVESYDVVGDSPLLDHWPASSACADQCADVKDDPEGCWCQLPDGHSGNHLCHHVSATHKWVTAR